MTKTTQPAPVAQVGQTLDLSTMVSRFLSWRLPDDFAPDAGITFTRSEHPYAAWPVGTNLLTAAQAKEMLEHVLSGSEAERAPQAWRDVQAERRRQIDEEGCPPILDDQHKPGELAQAAVAYLLYAYPRATFDRTLASRLWPRLSGFNPKDERRNLVRAAALALAELERFDRAAASAQVGE